MTFIKASQDYLKAIEKSGGLSAGASSGDGYDDGINWPWDSNGDTPNVDVNWGNANSIEAEYQKLIAWLDNNPGSYNGYLMLLKFTVDIGQNPGNLPPNVQAQVTQYISGQLNSTQAGGGTLLEMILKMAAEGAAVSQPTGAQGQTNAENFLNAIMNAVGSLQGSPFTDLFQTASDLRGKIDHWCQKHYKTFTDPTTGTSVSTWVGQGGQPISSFDDFCNEISFQVGIAFFNPTDPSSQSNVNNYINAFYQDEIAQLVAQFKGNPWALLVALMNLINSRDQNNGIAVNGYGNNLNTLKEANGLVQKLLGDISGTTPNSADFFKTLAQLKTLVEQDPALSGLVSQLESDMGTINGQTISQSSVTYNIGSAGFYNFPPGSNVIVNNQEITVPANGVVYIGNAGAEVTVQNSSPLTFGQLAAMGDTTAIDGTMSGWSSTVMSNFENGVTSIQTLLNGASPSIQQQMQNTTQTMQAEENFEKQAYDSITNMNQQIMKLISQVMG